jgi:hypothetical protein
MPARDVRSFPTWTLPGESVGALVGRSITADDVVAELDRLRRGGGAPDLIRCDTRHEWRHGAVIVWSAA